MGFARRGSNPLGVAFCNLLNLYFALWDVIAKVSVGLGFAFYKYGRHYSLVVERQPCKLKVLGSIPSGGFLQYMGISSAVLGRKLLIVLSVFKQQSQFARVVKGVDLRSTAGNCAWVRTPQLTNILFAYCTHEV